MARIVVIGRNYTSRLGMIRAVGSLGNEVYVIKTVRQIPTDPEAARDIDGYSKYVAKYLFALEPDRSNLVSVIKTTACSNGEKTLLIPVDDYAASTIDENIDNLKDNFLFPNVEMKQGAVNVLMDKNVQKELALKAGLDVAKGWVIDIEGGKYEIPADIEYHCFPKPQVSFTGNKTCMKRCGSRQELETVIQALVAQFPDCSLLVEQFIPIEREFATLGFSDGKNVVLPAMIEMLRDGSGAHKGVTMQGVVLPADEFKTFLDKAAQFIADMHFTGLFDIDSYMSGGKIYFNELNLRFGASGFAITKMGVNLPEMLVCNLLGKAYDGKTSVGKSAVFVNEKVVNDDMLNGFMSLWGSDKLVKSADFTFINDADDVKPYAKFAGKKLGLVRKLKITVKYILRCLNIR